MSVSREFESASARACIRALCGLEQTAIMLEKWGPEAFPANEQGKVHFGRAMTDSAAEAIRAAWTIAIKEVEAFPDYEAGWVEERGKLRNAVLEACADLGTALAQSIPEDDVIIMGHVKSALDGLRAALKVGVIR